MTSMSKSPVRTRRTPRQKTTLLRNVSVVLILVVLGGALALVLGRANATGVNAASSFVNKASIGNEFEIQSSKVALAKSQDDKVKQFAQQMIDDHGKAADDLATAASNASLSAPSTSLDRKHQKMLDKLNATTGKDFDKLYIHDQVNAHDEAVSLFKDYIKHGDNNDIKTFASDTLPTLQEHQQKIDQLKSSY